MSLCDLRHTRCSNPNAATKHFFVSSRDSNPSTAFLPPGGPHWFCAPCAQDFEDDELMLTECHPDEPEITSVIIDLVTLQDIPSGWGDDHETMSLYEYIDLIS